MSVDAPWVKLSQQGCEDLALSLNQPLWLRVSFMAYSRVSANGCAAFPQKQELAKILGKCRQDIDRAIRTAVEYGLLDQASSCECLRPPGGFIEMSLGSSRKNCAVHAFPEATEERSKEGRNVAAGQGEIAKHSVLQSEALSAAKPIHPVLREELVG